MEPSTKRGLVAGIAAIVLWCFTGLCFAAGSRALGPMIYTAGISAIGLAAGIAVQAARGLPVADLFRMPPRVWIAGFVGVSVYTVLLIYAVGIARDADVAQVVLVNYLWPLFIMAASAALLRRDRPARPAAVISAGLLGSCGVALARGPESLTRPPADLLPHAMAFVAAWLWALYCVLLRRWQVSADRNGSTAQWLLCALLASGVAWLRGEWSHMPALTWQAVLWTLGCGIGPVGLAYRWWEIGLKTGPPQTLAALSFFIPVGSALVMGLAIRETMGPMLVSGAALIALASALAHRAEGTPDRH